MMGKASIVQTVGNLDAFVASAGPGDSFVYMEAAEAIRGDTWRRVRELTDEGLVQPVSTPVDGNPGGARGTDRRWIWSVVRTAKAIRPAASAMETALSDPATSAILAILKNCAAKNQPCPSDAELQRKVGLNSRNQAHWRIQQLARLKLIERQVVYEGGVRTRVVTIVATGKSTRLPPQMAQMIAKGDGVLADLRSGAGL